MNEQIFFTLHGLAHQSCPTDKIIIFLADYLPYILIVLTIVYAFRADFGRFSLKNPFGIFKKRMGFLLDTLGLATISWLVTDILKGIINYPRPFIVFKETITPLFTHGGMDSFPSGHAAFFSALALSFFIADRRLGYIATACALLIGVTRVISGIHFPIDILFGYLIGLLVVMLYYLITDIKKRSLKETIE